MWITFYQHIHTEEKPALSFFISRLILEESFVEENYNESFLGMLYIMQEYLTEE